MPSREEHAQFPPDFGESRVGESATPAMTRIAGELSTDFARDDSEQAAQLFAPDAVLEDLTLHTAIVGRQSIAAYLARALPSLPYGQGAQVQLTSIWDGSLVTPAWITQHMSLTIES